MMNPNASSKVQKNKKNAKKVRSNRRKKKDTSNSYSLINFTNSGGLANGLGQTMIAPATSGRTITTLKPRFISSKTETLIRHSEYIQDIQASNDFIRTKVEVNPGLPQTFPWLSGLSGNYEKYKFKKLWFRYEVLSSTSQVGKVFFVPDFNVQEEGPTSKLDALSYELAIGSQPWIRFELNVPEHYLKVYNDYFLRSSQLPEGADIKTYDPLAMWICTEGMATPGISIGELWVDYEVELVNPLMAPNLIPYNRLFDNSYGNYFVPTGVDTRDIFGEDTIKNNFCTLSGRTITFSEDWTGVISLYLQYGGPYSRTVYHWPPVVGDPEGVVSLFDQSVPTVFQQNCSVYGATTEDNQWVGADLFIKVKRHGSFNIECINGLHVDIIYIKQCLIYMMPAWFEVTPPVFPTKVKTKKVGFQIIKN